MKQFSGILVLIFLTLSGCEKDAELQPKDYPYLITLEVTDINPTGVRFNAEVLVYGLDSIIDFGFVWYNNESQYHYSLYDHEGNTDNFTAKVQNNLVANQYYQCRAYIETTNQLVTGNEVGFTSSGSLPPEIVDFFPDTVTDGMSVTLVGKYFSPIVSNNEVTVNDISAEVVSASNDTIIFIMPEMAFQGNAAIKLSLNNQTISAPRTITIIGPEIHTLSIDEAQSGTYITVEGKHFLQGGNDLKLYFSDQEAEILDTIDKALVVVVPPPKNNYFDNVPATVKIVAGLKTNYYSGGFNILKSWYQHEPPPFTWNNEYGAFSYNGKGYILEIDSKQLYEYRPGNDHWYAISDYPGERFDRSVHLVFDDHVMIMGGVVSYSNKVRYVWVYNFTNNQWTQKPDLPFDFFRATHFRLNDLDYIITSEAEVWTYNQANDAFTQLNYFPVNFTYLGTSFVSNGVAYASTIGVNWQYDPLNDQWINISSNPFISESDAYNTSEFQYKDRGYIMYHGMDLYKFDTDRMQWIRASVFPASHGSTLYKTTFIIEEKVYLAVPDAQYQTGPFLFSYQEE
nr:hypothetical protein [Bacteroidota bacterium]